MISKFKTLKKIIITVKNWVPIVLVWFSVEKEVTAIFRNDFQTKVSKTTWPDFMRYVLFFYAFPDGKIANGIAKITYDNSDLLFDFSIKGPSVLGNLIEIFSQKIYEPYLSEFDLHNKNVIDIGGALGDTATYFALKGASVVYAFEPTPNFYELAQKNIKLNNVEDRCQIFNMAVGKVELDDNTKDDTFKEMFAEDPETEEYQIGDKKVPMVTLKGVVEKFAISNAFLKMDCEGYEYDIVLNAPKEILRKFDYILMEYHYGFESLQKKLENDGFQVFHTGPFEAIIDSRASKYSKMIFGYLTAKRID